MPGSPDNNSSFIPKRGPARRRKPKSKNQIFLFTIITYSLLFASLIAAGATYVYKNYLTSQLQAEVTSLNTAVTTFSTEDLKRVSEFDVTLKRAAERVDNSASVVAILDGLDQATVGPVQLAGLGIERDGDSSFELTGSVITSSFDAAIFQRKIYKANRRLFESADVNTVTIANEFETNGQEENESNAEPQQEVAFEVLLSVPLENALYDPATARMTGTEPVFATPIVSTSTPETVTEETSI